MTQSYSKLCPICNMELSIGAFYKEKSKKDGLSFGCKECTKRRAIAYSKTDQCKTMRRLWSKEYRKTEKYKAMRKEWFERNRHTERFKALATTAQFKFRQSDKWVKYQQTERHKALRAVVGHKRRVAKEAGEAIITAAEWLDIKKKYKYRCVYCGEKKKLTMDHIIPLSKGGLHSSSNILPACQSCNSRKNNKPVLLQILAMAGGQCL